MRDRVGRGWRPGMGMALGAALALVACDEAGTSRGPGPSTSEHGHVFFWAVGDSETTYDACSDAPAWRDQIATPTLGESSYLTYRVAADGQSAALVDCGTTDPATCSDTELEFAIDGSTLTGLDGPRDTPVSGSSCALRFDTVWTVVDEGATGLMDLELQVTLAGDEGECAALDGVIRDDSPNGASLDGCVVSVRGDLELDRHLAP